MPVSEHFLALASAALRWEPPAGLTHAVVATPAGAILTLLLSRNAGGEVARVDLVITPDLTPERLLEGLDECGWRVLSAAPCVCDDCRSQAPPSLDAAAAEFESALDRIAGEKES